MAAQKRSKQCAQNFIEVCALFVGNLRFSKYSCGMLGVKSIELCYFFYDKTPTHQKGQRLTTENLN
jgi:hypothetical protein